MSQSTKSYSTSTFTLSQALRWADKYSHFLFLNGNNHETLYGPFPTIIFAGKRTIIESQENSFNKLEELIQKKDWLYGYFSYELKDEIEELESRNPTTISVPHLTFAIPETIIKFEKDKIEITSSIDPDLIVVELNSTSHPEIPVEKLDPPTSKTTKQRYLHNIDKIKEAIVNGEFYELNYCIEYTLKAYSFDPIYNYQKLNGLSPMPFSALLKLNHKYLVCASPERFLKKEGDNIISQPIKGTIRRSFDKKVDDKLKNELKNSEKERAENLMIVDLVRNDLARTSRPGTVKVEELFGIYTFKRIHQMISTITSKYDVNHSITDIIKKAFPMGSMTGAPKIRVLKEIEELEDSARGLFSGSVGYFSPEGNFDFNVVIRSLVYDAESNQISFHVGSAITYDSDPEHEYRECLLKAETLFEVLSK